MIEPTTQAAILAEFDQQVGLYGDMASTAAALLSRMVDGMGVQLHSITHRCKTRDSLAAKLRKPEKDYSRLSDITDLAAVRITTYFAEDVDRVASIVEAEFSIDEHNSTDKRKLLDPDRFGYQSLHYVATVTPDRARLIEYARFSEQKFEIQVRSILQHAWAEIEHDLGYKSAAGVPKEIRRRFSRVAGLLELADDEFSAIRRELEQYAATVAHEIQEQPESVGIDKISLRAVASTAGSVLRDLSTEIAAATGAVLEASSDAIVERNVQNLAKLEISTVAELERAIRLHRACIMSFAIDWLDGARYDTFHEQIGVFYLAYVILANRGDTMRLRHYLDEAHIGEVHERDGLAARVMSTYKKTCEGIGAPAA